MARPRIFLSLAAAGFLLAGCTGAALQPPKPPPAPPPDHPPGVKPLGAGPKLVYPTSLLAKHREGEVQVECTATLAVDHNRTKDCVVAGGSPEPEFRQAALDYITQSRFAPAIRNGVAVEERGQWRVGFKLLEPLAPMPGQPAPAGMVMPRKVWGEQLFFPEQMRLIGQQGSVVVECVIGTDGKTRNCRILNGAGGELFYYWALDYAQDAVFAPALMKGVPVDYTYRWTIPFLLRNDWENPPPLPAVPPVLDVPLHAMPLYGDSHGDAHWYDWIDPDPRRPSGSGTIGLSCLVGIDGRARDCTVTFSSGDAHNDAALLQMMAEQKFGPRLSDGLPVETRAEWRIRFDSKTASFSPIGQ